jgi:hypothetical protein
MPATRRETITITPWNNTGFHTETIQASEKQYKNHTRRKETITKTHKKP